MTSPPPFPPLYPVLPFDPPSPARRENGGNKKIQKRHPKNTHGRSYLEIVAMGYHWIPLSVNGSADGRRGAAFFRRGARRRPPRWRWREPWGRIGTGGCGRKGGATGKSTKSDALLLFFFRDGNKSSFAAAASAGRQTRPGSAHATDYRTATRAASVNGAGKPVEVGGGYVCRVFRGTRARHKFYSSLGRGRPRKTLCRARHHTRSSAFNPTLPYLVDSGGEMVVTGIGVLVRVWFGVCKKRSVVKGDVFGLCPFLFVHFFVHFIFLFIANRPVSWKLAGHGQRDRVPGECLSGRTKATRGGGGTRDRGETLVGARLGRICVGGVRHACLTISGLSHFLPLSYQTRALHQQGKAKPSAVQTQGTNPMETELSRSLQLAGLNPSKTQVRLACRKRRLPVFVQGLRMGLIF